MEKITKEWIEKTKKELKEKNLPTMLRKISIAGNIYVIRPITYKEFMEINSKYMENGEQRKEIENDEDIKKYTELSNKVRNMIIETLQARDGRVLEAEVNKYMRDPDLLLAGRKDYQEIADEYNRLTGIVNVKIEKATTEAMDIFNKKILERCLLYPEDIDVESIPVFAIGILVDKIMEISGQTDDVIVEAL